jgi:uncharacterized protein (DUF1684 family)
VEFREWQALRWSDDVSLTLLDWRRTVSDLYRDVRAHGPGDPVGALERFRAAKDRLFASHPDSPIMAAEREAFAGLRYWPYDPALRFEVDVEPIESQGSLGLRALSLAGDEFALDRIGRISLPMGTLDIYWVAVYGGGVFLPFRDASNGSQTYSAGRYLIDTVKGADLGGSGGRLVVDFNYAYHPSCTYDPKWSCPLAPPANRLEVPIRAGERLEPAVKAER